MLFIGGMNHGKELKQYYKEGQAINVLDPDFYKDVIFDNGGSKEVCVKFDTYTVRALYYHNYKTNVLYAAEISLSDMEAQELFEKFIETNYTTNIDNM